ncbi:hypothetical protein BE17_40155 [Sorangium cellulosum]|uniref:Uncharacterized protein n=1 Tax=Sorangium cellulosum TaxID=56 RepID=A0A150RT85_SORCE|nr:hypothetical protein BE17_40155 [Sorangium cellulosum]
MEPIGRRLAASNQFGMSKSDMGALRRHLPGRFPALIGAIPSRVTIGAPGAVARIAQEFVQVSEPIFVGFPINDAEYQRQLR